MQCAKCGSEKIMEGLSILDRMSSTAVGNLSIELNEHLKSIGVFAAPPNIRVPLHANVCGNCGYVELSISDLEGLWEVYCQFREAEELAKNAKELAKQVAKDEEAFARRIAEEGEEEFAKWVAKDPARSYLSRKEQLSLYRKSLSERLINE